MKLLNFLKFTNKMRFKIWVQGETVAKVPNIDLINTKEQYEHQIFYSKLSRYRRGVTWDLAFDLRFYALNNVKALLAQYHYQ